MSATITTLINVRGALKAFSEAHTTLYVVPLAKADGERWGPVLCQVVSVTEDFAHGWTVDNDGMAQYRVKVPLAEIGTIEVVDS